MKPKPVDLSAIITKELQKGSYIIHKGKLFTVASLITYQYIRCDIITGRKAGFTKPEITVYRVHCGKILKRTNKYIGLNYKVASNTILEALGVAA